MLYSTQAGKLHGLRRPTLNPSLQRPEPRSACCHVPPAPSPAYLRAAVPEKTGKQVNPSPTFTPKFAACWDAANTAQEEAWQTWGELKPHCKLVLQHAFESQLWAFFSQILCPSKNRRGTSEQQVVPILTSPRDPLPTPQARNVAGETQSPHR